MDGVLFWASVIPLIPACLCWLLALRPWRRRDLRQRYDGLTWALVTGASSGLGKELAAGLATAGLDVVLVALPDALLPLALSELQQRFPTRTFLQVGADLSDPSGLQQVVQATRHVCVQLVIANAGYCINGPFADMQPAAIDANIHCNTTSALQLARHFSGLMVRRQCKGAVAFVSSCLAFSPMPTMALYAATKAALSAAAMALSLELQPFGIDVLAVHPGPLRTRFFDRLDHGHGTVPLSLAVAVDAAPAARAVLTSFGQGCCVVDIGWFAVVLRVLWKAVDVGGAGAFLSHLWAS